MGNQLDHLSEDALNRYCNDKCDSYRHHFEYGLTKKCIDYNGKIDWSGLFTFDTKRSSEIKREYSVIDPANHLYRLICIWQIAPLTDICKHIWKIYCDLHLENKTIYMNCIICTQQHTHFTCPRYRKCTICPGVGHLNDDCPMLCSCGEKHMRTQHICELCDKKGHHYLFCPDKCSCGNHLKNHHKCYICGVIGHLGTNCSKKCQCGEFHPKEFHRCKRCFRYGHTEDNCCECVCKSESKYVTHFCRKINKKRMADTMASDVGEPITKKRKSVF